MSDALPLTAREFAAFYGISRERLSRIIASALRDHSGVFGLADLGYFKATMVDPRRMQIEPYTAPRSVLEAIPQFALKGRLDPAALNSTSAPASSPAQPAPPATSNPEAPSKYELELRVLAERATALRQRNVLEQARLREETVSYCSAAVRVILASLRSDIDSLRLDPAASARLRSAIDSALQDLNSVLPSIIEGTPVERIELELSARRAARITASLHHAATEQPVQTELTPESTRKQTDAAPDHTPNQFTHEQEPFQA